MFSSLARRMLAALLSLVMLSGVLGCFSLSAVDSGKAQGQSSGNTGTESAGYKQKVIAVVYDNSASMNDRNDRRCEYAKYSLQILLSVVGTEDEVVIVCMNDSSNQVSDRGVLTPDLKNGDRSATISGILDNSLIANAKGSYTPYGAVTKALGELEERGMPATTAAGDGESEKEYWLVVLTDGLFASLPTGDLASSLRSSLSNYSGLHTIYFGMGPKADDLASSGLTTEMPFTALKAPTAVELVNGMQTVSGLISGKYALPESAYSVSGNTVTLDLEKLSFPFRNISIMVQNCGVTLQKATYEGATLTPTQYNTIKGNSSIGITDGYAASFFNSSHFSGGKLILTFSGAVNKQAITFLGEPALSVQSSFEYRKGGQWLPADINSINSNLTKNDSIRVNIKVLEQANGTEVTPAQLTAIFGDYSAQVIYGGRSYQPGESIPLLLGKNELSVSASMMNGSYKLSRSYVCAIAENPTYYRIEAQTEERYGGDRDRLRVLYTVFEDNQPLSKAQLASYRYEIKATAADGSELPLTPVLQNDGRISAVVDVAGKGSGVVRFTCKVTSPLNVSRTLTTEANAWAYRTLQILPQTATTLRFSQAELVNNTTPMSFAFLTDGDEGNLEDGSIAYTVSVDGTDVTSFVTVSGNILSFVPTIESLGQSAGTAGGKTVTVKAYCPTSTGVTAMAGSEFELTSSALLVTESSASVQLTPYQLGQNKQQMVFRVTLDGVPLAWDASTLGVRMWVGSEEVTSSLTFRGEDMIFVPTREALGAQADTIGDKAVRVEVFFTAVPSLSAECRTNIKVIASSYEIQILPGTVSTVNRFNIEGSNSFFTCRILRDGVALTAEEMAEALAKREIRLSGGAFFLPYGVSASPSEQAGEGVLTCMIVRDQPRPLSTFTAMLVGSGTKTVGVSCGGATAQMDVSFTPSPIFQYIWRILVILLVLYLITYLLCGCFVCKHFRKGKMVILAISERHITVQTKSINRSFSERYSWHLKRFLPWRLAMNQPDTKGLTFKIGEEKKGKRPKVVARFRLKSTPANRVVRVIPDGDTTVWNEFRSLLKKQNKARLDMTTEEVRGLFSIGEEIGVNPKLDSSYYATLNRAGNIVRIQFFMYM